MSIIRGGCGAEVDVEGQGVRRGLVGGGGGGVGGKGTAICFILIFVFNTIQKNIIVHNKRMR